MHTHCREITARPTLSAPANSDRPQCRLIQRRGTVACVVGRARPVYLGIFLFILAPVASAVIITALLLFGTEPSVVFAPGRAVQSVLEFCGLRVANRVAVASTAFFWWAIIAAVGLARGKRRGRSAGQTSARA